MKMQIKFTMLKHLKKLHNTDWNDWIETYKNSDINVVYNSFHSLFQSKIVLETRKANRKKPIQPWMTYEILAKKRKMDIDRKKFLKKRNERNEIQYTANISAVLSTASGSVTFPTVLWLYTEQLIGAHSY